MDGGAAGWPARHGMSATDFTPLATTLAQRNRFT